MKVVQRDFVLTGRVAASRLVRERAVVEDQGRPVGRLEVEVCPYLICVCIIMVGLEV